MAGRYEVVLFDLGGVLVEVAGVGPMKELAGIDDDEELWARWLTCRWVRDFERGDCSAEEFAAGVVADWKLPIEQHAFLAAFARWPGGPMEGAAELVAGVRATTPTGCLSNTNSLHWDEHLSKWPLVAAFDYRFLSFELGSVKPDAEVFERIAARLPVGPDRVLVLDDNALNVQGAMEFGFAATRVRGVDEARQALVAAGVLASASD
jgi:HAD superfamily hydrolase (TIGR01509 family)